MYAALWRILPGPLWVRIAIVAAIVAGVSAVLVLWAFPWALLYLMPVDSTVGGQ